jgi:hypothetical protein
MLIKTPTEMIGVIGHFANPCKWVHIGCKSGQNFDTSKNPVVINSSIYNYLSTPCIATIFLDIGSFSLDAGWKFPSRSVETLRDFFIWMGKFFRL